MILHSRFGGGIPDVPLIFVRGGVLYECLMGMRGGPKVVLSYSQCCTEIKKFKRPCCDNFRMCSYRVDTELVKLVS